VAFAYEILDNYLDADARRLRKYSSHYAALNSWVFTSEKFEKRFPPSVTAVDVGAPRRYFSTCKCGAAGRWLTHGVCDKCDAKRKGDAK